MAVEVAITGEVDRTKPHAELDGTDIDWRISRYRELMVNPAVVTKHVLSDEGSYFTTNGAQTAQATAATPTAFSATNPFLIIYNKSDPSDDFAQRIYLDYITLCATAAGTAGASVQFAVTVDTGNRYTSGGVELSANSVTVGPTSTATLSRAFAGNITAAAASSTVKTVVGNRYMKGTIPVAGDTYTVRFGSSSAIDMIGVSTSVYTTNNLPPVIIGPNQCAILHLWLPSQSAASSYLVEAGWWER